MATSDRRLAAARPDLADERLRGTVQAERYVAGREARIVAPCAPLRRRPAPDAPLDTEALMGEPVRIFDERDGYAWAQLLQDGYVGYLPSSVLGAEAPAPTHRVRAVRTFVYPAPDLKTPPLSFLSLGAAVGASGEVERGYLPLAGGGYAWAAHLRPVSEREPDYVAVAERLLGAPYLWGGKSSLGIDCSGLVQLALAAAGIAAPRDSDMQEAGLGQPLPEGGSLARGDVVFWKGHVGLMLDGARLLHANGHHMAVAIEPLAEAESRIREGGGGPVTMRRRLPEHQRPRG
ncbi:C40 family peptidase [Enterovirga rhinocerotis]|uniref:Cell wall-associated NlpC family hydrolase n=1 Tax=Enterovirga rhinocerotis TaxID=1339210 RepID=A0A4V3DXU7_9HYPH|nr:NlpC/P60 family protein [Enterovirga rhinocerotis]TDR90139.1 cell wall-associated NlpC family hydrolase [Enterovirga rhinocerotis]